MTKRVVCAVFLESGYHMDMAAPGEANTLTTTAEVPNGPNEKPTTVGGEKSGQIDLIIAIIRNITIPGTGLTWQRLDRWSMINRFGHMF